MTHRKNADAVGALHHDAKCCPDGISGLARLIGRSPGVLHNKFSDAMPNYEITDHEADALALKVRELTGAMGYIEAKCATFGGIFVPLPEGMAGEDDLMQAQLEMITRFGDLAREFTESRRDGVITDDEVGALRTAGNRVIRAVHMFLREIETQVEPTPKPVRPVMMTRGAA